MKTYKIIKSLILITMLWLTACTSDKRTLNHITPDSIKTQNVEVINPDYRSFVTELLITGTAEPNREVQVHAMESGYVKTVFKDIGDKVNVGEVIVVLENPELHQQLQQLTAEYEGKKSIYERLLSTYETTPAITPLQILEDAKAEYFSLKARLDATYNRISFLKVKAPFSGIITQRFVDEGALVQSGIYNSDAKPLFEIQEVNPIRLTISVPETNAVAVKIGMEVIISFPELPGKSFTAKVSRTSNSLDRDSKTMKVEIDIPNSNNKIKPGMYAKTLMKINSRDSVLSLPVTSQIIFQNQQFVMVVEEGKVDRVLLRKGLSNRYYFEILNDDISKQSQVIVQGKGLVKPGQIVKPIFKTE